MYFADGRRNDPTLTIPIVFCLFGSIAGFPPSLARLRLSGRRRLFALSLLFNHDDLAVLGRVSERGYAPDPQPLALGGRDFVADALGGDFPLELGKRQEDIERQPPHRGRRIELLGDGDER